MATIYIDNRPYDANPQQNLLQVCLSLGFNLPYFCWHPALGAVGACRQCAVQQFKDAQDTRGRLVMACMTPAADNTRISIDDPDAKTFRASVIEDTVQCCLAGMTYRLPVQVDPALPRGIAGLPVGLPGFQPIPLPTWSALSKVTPP